jgi:hypothetical protein
MLCTIPGGATRIACCRQFLSLALKMVVRMLSKAGWGSHSVFVNATNVLFRAFGPNASARFGALEDSFQQALLPLLKSENSPLYMGELKSGITACLELEYPMRPVAPALYGSRSLYIVNSASAKRDP